MKKKAKAKAATFQPRSESTFPPSAPPMLVSTAEAVERKMEAIIILSRTVESLARAIGDCGVNVNVTGCRFENHVPMTGPMFSIGDMKA